MTGLFVRFADRANALVVLELRRGMRARVFSVAFALVLVACVVIALSAYGGYEPGGSAGQVAFVAFFACLAVAGFFVLPYGVFRSLSRERVDHTWPLVILTRMRPRQILAGKVGSCLAQAVLYASAVAPFLLFSYLLQGIDLVSVALLMACAAGLHLLLTVGAATAATLAESRVFRGLIHLAVLGGLAWSTVTAVVFAGMLVEGTGSPTTDPDFWVGLGFTAWLAVSFGLVFFAVGVGRLTFESDNRGLWPRLALSLQWAGNAAAAALAAHLGRDGDFGVALASLGAVLGWVAGLFGATGPAGLSRRLAQGRKWPLLMPGAVASLLFHLVLILGYSVAGAALALRHGSDGEAAIALGCGLFAVLYLSLPVALARGPLRHLLPGVVARRVFAVALTGVAWGLPALAGVVLGLGKESMADLNFFNPLFALEQLADRADPGQLLVLGAVAAAVALWAFGAALARDREARGG